MIQLTKNMIRNLASSEKTFLRGMQYFQNGRIQNASYSKTGKRYKITVKGKQLYTVLIEEQEDGSFLTSCNCPDVVKEKGACKHVVAALLMLLKHQERSEGNLPKNAEEKRAYQVLEYFDNQESMAMTGMWVTVCGLTLCGKEKNVLRTMAKQYHPYLAGVLAALAYVLILLAMNYVSNVSFVQAFRQLSLPISALLGFFILKEKITKFRWLALALIMLGLVLSVLK